MHLRRALSFLSLTSLVVLGLAAACSSGDDDSSSSSSGSSGSDGATDGTFATDVLPPLPEAEPPPGNVCGTLQAYEPSSSWPLRGGCPTRAGFSMLAGPQSARVRWTTPLHAGGNGESSPAISAQAGVVWVGTTEGDIVGILNGEARWAYRTGGDVRSSPALDTFGTAIVGSADGTLYGVAVGSFGGNIDAGAGGDADASPYPPARLVFSIPLGGPITSSPVIGTDGTIYVGVSISGGGKLAAVTVANNVAVSKWTASTNDANGSSPALGQDGTIYVGSSDHKLYAIHPDGSSAWSTDIGSEIKGSPAVGGDGSIYIGGVDGKLHALDTAGKEKWVYATGGPITGTPAVLAGAVYVGSDDKFLHAVNVVNGTKRWVYQAAGPVASPIIGPDRNVYVGAADTHLYAITEKGSLYFAASVKGNVRGAAAIGSSADLYVSTDNGVVAIGQ